MPTFVSFHSTARILSTLSCSASLFCNTTKQPIWQEISKHYRNRKISISSVVTEAEFVTNSWAGRHLLKIFRLKFFFDQFSHAHNCDLLNFLLCIAYPPDSPICSAVASSQNCSRASAEDAPILVDTHKPMNKAVNKVKFADILVMVYWHLLTSVYCRKSKPRNLQRKQISIGNQRIRDIFYNDNTAAI